MRRTLPAAPAAAPVDLAPYAKTAAVAAGFARVAVPTAAGARAGFYDPVRNLYVPTTTGLARLRAALGRASAGSLVNLVGVGDSKMAGYLAGQASSWLSVVRARLAALGVPSAGTGLVPVANQGAVDSQWSGSSGTWSDGNLYSTSGSAGASRTFTSREAGTVVELWYFSTSAAFTYSIDGAAAVTVTPSGSGPVRTTITGLADTTHTIVITAASATPVYLIGACVRRTAGLLIHNLGIVGATAANFATTAFSQPLTIAAALTPDVLAVEVGSNDAGNSVPVATYAANLAAIHAALPNAAKLHVVESPRGTLPSWPSFVSAAYDRADAAGAPLLDTTDRWGTAAAAQALGLLGADSLHETAAGHADIGRAISHLLAA